MLYRLLRDKINSHLLKVILRIGANDTGVLVGEISSDMPSPAFVCDERTKTTCTIYRGLLGASPHLCSTLRRLHHRQLH